MVSKGPGRQGARWRAAQKLCMAESAAMQVPCWFCAQPIDYEFTKWNHLHRLAGTVHHIIGLEQGGDPLDPANLTPAHRGCNCRDGAVKLNERQRRNTRIAPIRSSRNW
jgi:5-methylcytosine-specific restriction endonuclease McrA